MNEIVNAVTAAADNQQHSRETVGKRLIEHIVAQVSNVPTDLSMDTRFDAIEIDSVDLVNVVFAVEEEFGIDIPLGDERVFVTLADFADRVVALLAEQGKA